MKIILPNDSRQSIGGGWTFRRNLEKGLKKKGMVIVDTIEECDIALIAGATMITRDTAIKIKELGKKMILRIDNIPRNSRNRNTGTSRLRDFSILSDVIVYQSEWSMEYLMPFIGRVGKIIYNGVDTEIFYKKGWKRRYKGNPVYLYSRYSRDETKRWEEAWYEYQMIQRRNPKAFLVIVGNFSQEQKEYNFDFFMNEKYKYEGIIIEPQEMANIYRGCDYLLATYYNDCYSNTYCEAIACGVQLYKPNLSGGTREVMEQGIIPLDKMAEDYIALFKEVISR